MLKRIVIASFFGVLAAVCLLKGQTAPFSPPKERIAKPSGSQNGKDKTQPQENSQPAPNPVTIGPQPATPTCDEACQQGRQNLAIQRKLEWFTGVLAIVGVLQVVTMVWQAILLYKTRGDVHTQAEWMKTQAGYMKDQTKILRGSVAVAQTSADAAMAQIRLMKNKERGRLRIEFDKPDLVHGPDPDNGYELPFRLILDGTTQVYIAKSSCFIGIHDSGDPVGEPWWNSMGVPETITPENRIYKGTATILTGEKPWGEPITGVDEARVALVREDKLHVFARGYILYEDIFDGSWEVRFNHRWQYGPNFYTFDGIDLSGGWWVSIGDNGEYRIESVDPTDPNDEPWDNQSQ
jgi:hypothetical protein